MEAYSLSQRTAIVLPNATLLAVAAMYISHEAIGQSLEVALITAAIIAALTIAVDRLISTP